MGTVNKVERWVVLLAIGLVGFVGERSVNIEGTNITTECVSLIQVDTVGEIYRDGKIDQYSVDGEFQPYPVRQDDGLCHTLAGVPRYFRENDMDAFGLEGLSTKPFEVVGPDGSVKTEDIFVNDSGIPLGAPRFPASGKESR